MGTPPATHPDAAILQAFGLGKLDDSSSGVLLAHLDLCADCRQVVASQSGDDFLERIRQAHSRSTTPAPAKSLGGMAGKPKPPPGPTTLFNLPPELADNPQYEILKELGHGGMGVVYLAKNKLMDRLEVLKVINKALLDRPGAVERFLREIRAAAKLNHLNVVNAHSALQLGDLLVFAMEYVEGQDLAAVVKANGPLPVAHACFYVQQAAQGLQHAFEKKMVHRDIKPQNLILAREGRKHLVKVLDFGLAKVMREKTEDTGLTGEGKMLGTPDYMAPEQTLDATSADIRADIYSLGCTLYFLLSGSRPFKGKNLYEIMQAHQTLEAPALNVSRPEVPAELSAVVRKMMAKDRASRYQTPLDVVQALGPFLKQSASSKPSPVPSVGTAQTVSVSLASAKPPPLPATPAQPPVAWDSLTESVIAATQSPRTGAARGARNQGLMGATVAVGLLVLGLLSYYLAAVLFRVETPNGTLVVEMHDEEVEARIKNGKLILTGPDGKVRYTLTANDRNKKLAAGPYQIRVEGADGLVVDTPEFTLTKGSEVTVRVRLQTKEVPQAAAAAPADALRRADIPKAVLASIGGGDPKRAPPELVAVLGDGRFRLTDISRFPAYSPDGALLAVPNGGEVFLFDANSGQLLRRFRGRGGRVGSVAFSPNGAVLAMGDEEIVRLWDPRSGVLVQDLSGHARGMIGRVVFTPDNQTVMSCSSDKTVRAWDATTGRQTRVFSCKAGVYSIAITTDGRLVVAGTYDGRVYGWSLDTGVERFVVTHENVLANPAHFVSVSADGQWLASGTNGLLKVWNIADLAKKDAAPFFEKQTPASWLQFEKKSNKLWTAESNDRRTANRACCWDPLSGQLVSSVTLQSTDSPYLVYALSPDDRILTGFGCERDRMVQLYDTRTGKPRFPDPGHTREVWTVAFSPDGRWLASGSVDRTVRVWDLATGTPLHKLEGHTEPVWSVVFSPDGKLLASASRDGTIALWDPVTGARVRLLRGHFGESCVRFSPDGKFVASGTADGGVRMWSVRNGEEARMLRGLHEKRFVRCLAFRGDGQRLATGGDDGKLVITDLASGKVLQSFQRNTAVFTVEFSADGETVAAGYVPHEPVVRLWNLKDKDFVSLNGHTDRLSTVSLRSDGRLAVTASLDGSVRLWEIGSNVPRKMVLGTGSVGERLWMGALSPDGRYVATGNSNGTIYLFRLPAATENIGEWLAARSSPPRGLTEKAWLERVKSLYVANVPDAISDRLCELNPGFDRQVSPVIEGGVVTELRFGCPNVKDISPLRALPELRTLVCVEGPLADLSPLKDLPLTALEISRTQVSDLTPIKNMKLTRLHCADTRVSDLTPLKDMKLTYLHCGATKVSNLTPLKDMKLTFLDCGGTKVAELSPLKHMKLTELYVTHTEVSDLSPLKDMKLTKLWCVGAQVTDATPASLQEMSSLRVLEIGGPKMTDAGLEYLKQLTDLEELKLPFSKLTGDGLVHLKGMTRLQFLRLDNTQLTDAGLVHLKGLFGLREIYLPHTRVTDAGLEHLAGLKNLAHLDLRGTAVTDKGLAKLRAALSKCNITR